MAVLKPKNIYYMLSYAYRVLTQGEFKNLDSEEFDNIHNLFAEIISLGISNQIKRGLIREYEEHTDEIKTIRGKICVKNSLRGLSGKSDTITCSFDEYTLNTSMNQVLKTTMYYLIKSDEVSQTRKNKLKNLMKYFSDVELINPHLIKWNTFRYHRNNAAYKMLMNLCYLILSGMILSDTAGTHKLAEFIDDQKMHALYEKFILEYYRREFPELKAAKKEIAWDLSDADEMMISLLPKMITDITLTWENKALIIDAKYYGHSVAESVHSDKKIYLSSNLYQIQAYVKNMDKERTGNVEGMLLYAKTDDEAFNESSGVFGGNKISVRTLDLSGDWKDIDSKLKTIAEEFKESASA